MRREYQFNPEDLTFSIKPRAAKSTWHHKVLFWSVAVILAGGCVYLFTHLFETPKERSLRAQNAQHRLELRMLSERVAATTDQLNRLEVRDDHIYRPLFEADTLGQAVRMGGVGGVERYAQYSMMRNGSDIADLAKGIDQLAWRTKLQLQSSDQVLAMAFEKDRMVHSIPIIQPVAVKSIARITSHFGVRIDPFTHAARMHSGLDFVAAAGTPIYATGDGVVETAEYHGGGYGRQVVVNHGFGYKTRYAHLKTIDVQAGERIKRGQQVGTMGSTGRSTATHLHYEVLYHGQARNPLLYLNSMSEEEYEALLSRTELEAMD